ncbi:MAG TPA: NADH-quinone oxidoreductase subunit NuoE [Bacteroidota bacterium]|nr:NADH-quinone oxidoreductase subunit NuoE [Bacteroidota bacterium]
MLSDKNLQRIEELKKRYPNAQPVLLEALWMWQDEHGWISQEGMKYVAQKLDIPYHHVFGVVTFYTMYNSKPVGRHKIEVCTNVSCMLRNSEKLVKHLEDKLRISVGETTSDKRFTLMEAECLGSCGTAPMMQVGDEYFENLDEEKVDRILSELK